MVHFTEDRRSLLLMRGRMVGVFQGIGHRFVTTSKGDTVRRNALAFAVGLIAVGSTQATYPKVTPSARPLLLHVVQVGHDPVSSVVVSRTNRVFVVNQGSFDRVSGRSSGDGSVSILATDTAKVVRTVRIGVRPQSISADDQTGRVFVLNEGDITGHGSVSVLDARTGAVLQTVVVRGSPRALTVDTWTQRVFVEDANETDGVNDMIVLDAQTGAVLRTVPVGLKTGALSVDERAGHVLVATSSATRSDVVVLLDARTGGLVRTVPVGYDLGAMAVDALTARAFVLSGGVHRGYVEVLDTRTGVVIAQRSVSEVVPLVLTVDTTSAHAFVVTPYDGAGGNSITVLDARTGAILPFGSYGGRGRQSENPTDAIADPRRHHLYVLAQGPLGSDDTTPLTPGSVAIFDTITGKLLRTVTTGKRPQSVSVDEQRGRVFLCNQNDDTVSVIDGSYL